MIERCADVVWRLCGDRVLVRRAGGDGSHADLIGLAGAAWLASDEPADIVELHERIADATEPVVIDRDAVEAAVGALVDAGWLCRAAR